MKKEPLRLQSESPREPHDFSTWSVNGLEHARALLAELVRDGREGFGQAATLAALRALDAELHRRASLIVPTIRPTSDHGAERGRVSAR